MSSTFTDDDSLDLVVADDKEKNEVFKLNISSSYNFSNDLIPNSQISNFDIIINGQTYTVGSKLNFGNVQIEIIGYNSKSFVILNVTGSKYDDHCLAVNHLVLYRLSIEKSSKFLSLVIDSYDHFKKHENNLKHPIENEDKES